MDSVPYTAAVREVPDRDLAAAVPAWNLSKS